MPFAREARGWRPSPFGQLRDLVRRVQADYADDVDTNSYSAYRLIGAVKVTICAGRIIVRHAGEVVADHAVSSGRRQRITDRAHLAGAASCLVAATDCRIYASRGGGC